MRDLPETQALCPRSGSSGLFQNLHRLAHLCYSEDQKGCLVLDGRNASDLFRLMLDRWHWWGKEELADHGRDLHREFTSFPHPRAAEGEREIIAYLLENRQKMFEVRPDGEETATLLAKGFVVHEVRTLAVSSRCDG